MEYVCPTNTDAGAFGNKFKSLITAIRSKLNYKVCWLEGFPELLETHYSAVNKEDLLYRLGCWRLALTHKESIELDTSFRDQYPEFFDCEYIPFNLTYSRLRTIDGEYNRIPYCLKLSLTQAVASIPWNNDMCKLFYAIDQVTDGKRLLGVSVRSWKNKYELSNPLAQHRAKSFSIERYIQVIKEYMDDFDNVVLSLDNDTLESEFEWLKNRFVFDSNLLEPYTPFQRIAAKAYMLSKCSLLIGDKQSTFIEAAWLLGGCRQHVLLL